MYLKFCKKMKNNCSFKKKNYKERALKFGSEVLDGLLSFSTQRRPEQHYQQNSKNQTVGTQRDLRDTKSCGTKRNEQDLGYLNAKSIQQGQEKSHSSLRWLLQGPAPPLKESPCPGPGTAPGCSDCPAWLQPHSCWVRQHSWTTISPVSCLGLGTPEG